ncbi:MAG: hypothetical protein CMI18_00785 [Opitutaceae bacterium]|nr:hypothetical protein [Opitutaceae bacterium]
MKEMEQSSSNRISVSGFTLVELMVVVVIPTIRSCSILLAALSVKVFRIDQPW